MKVVINTCYGGFGISRDAFLRLRELGQKDALEEADFGEYWSDGSGPRENWSNFFCSDISRTDEYLIQVVKELKEKANCEISKLKIVNIPNNVDWEIKEYDGKEWIAEKHRTWR